jgi:hypothetical protein
MATFNGVNLGFVFEMNVAPNPKARQVNAYAGANGLEVIDQGSRGGTSYVEGALISASPNGLAAAEQSFRALQVDGRSYLLVDTLGTTWPGVTLIQFAPKGRVCRAIVPGGLLYYARCYHMDLLHVF